MTTPYKRALDAGDLDDGKGGRFWDGARDKFRRRGAAKRQAQLTSDNGSVANPIKGVQAPGQTRLKGGAF